MQPTNASMFLRTDAADCLPSSIPSVLHPPKRICWVKKNSASVSAARAVIELLPVLLQGIDFLGARPEATDQGPMQLTRRFRQPVMHPKPFLASDYQSPFPEIRQMAGHSGLGQV